MRFVTIGRTRERRSDRAAKVHCTISTRLLHLYIYSKCTGRVTSKPFCLVQFVAVSYRRYARLTLYKVIRERPFDYFFVTLDWMWLHTFKWILMEDLDSLGRY